MSSSNSQTFIRGLSPKESMDIGIEVAWMRKISDSIIQVSGEPENPITLDTTLKSDLGLDDLDIIEVLMYVEKEFDVYFEDNEDKIVSIRDIVDYLKTKLLK